MNYDNKGPGLLKVADAMDRIGKNSQLNDYVKSLPKDNLDDKLKKYRVKEVQNAYNPAFDDMPSAGVKDLDTLYQYLVHKYNIDKADWNLVKKTIDEASDLSKRVEDSYVTEPPLQDEDIGSTLAALVEGIKGVM